MECHGCSETLEEWWGFSMSRAVLRGTCRATCAGSAAEALKSRYPHPRTPSRAPAGLQFGDRAKLRHSLLVSEPQAHPLLPAKDLRRLQGVLQSTVTRRVLNWAVRHRGC